MLPLLLAGSGLASAPASAVQLGELEVQSSLGQPLRASIAYALSPNEQIHDYCIFLKSGITANGLPVLSRARLSVADGRINIVGRTPLNEPLLSLGLTIDCPYTPNLTRSYTLMLDPYQPEAERVATVESSSAIEAAPSREQPSVRADRSSSTAGASSQPIGPTGSYRVQIGDSLSTIAARIEDRPIGLWQAVDALFRANPDAFIDGDMNRLKAGSLLTIPSFDGVSAPQIAADRDAGSDAPSGTTAAPSVVEEPATVDAPLTAYEPGLAATGEEATEPGAAESSEQSTVGSTAESTPESTSGLTTESDDATAVEDPAATAEPTTGSATDITLDQTDDLRPGDVLLGDDASFVSPIDTPAAADPAAVSDAADPSADQTGASDSWSAMYWLAGTGVALILGLLMFGRRLRGRASPPAAPVQEAQTIADDDPTTENRALQIDDADVDFDIGDDEDAQQAYSLDADLSAGTGLKAGTNIEVAQDFGFSATSDLGSDVDLELPADDSEDDAPSTDILPPQRMPEETILEREILPTDDDDEYDLSMIVDATKQRFGDGDITEKNLMAVPVSGLVEEESVEDYTLSNEVDYKILEQDYEDELTATQALNAEIAKAAIELAGQLDETMADPVTGDSSEPTAELEAADDELEITSEHTVDLEAELADDELSDDDDTGINEQLTAEMPIGDETAELTAADDQSGTDPADTTATTELTAPLPAAENDPTVEMDVESGRAKTGKSVG